MVSLEVPTHSVAKYLPLQNLDFIRHPESEWQILPYVSRQPLRGALDTETLAGPERRLGLSFLIRDLQFKSDGRDTHKPGNVVEQERSMITDSGHFDGQAQMVRTQSMRLQYPLEANPLGWRDNVYLPHSLHNRHIRIGLQDTLHAPEWLASRIRQRQGQGARSAEFYRRVYSDVVQIH